MKTINSTTLLPVLLMWVVCFGSGCQQQTTQTSSSPTMIVDGDGSTQQSDTYAANPDTDTHSSQTDTPLATAGSPEITDGIPDQDTPEQDTPLETSTTDEDNAPTGPTIKIPATWKRLSQTQEIWLDAKKKQVIVGGKVCFDNGPLEMLICPKETKEHESIVSINAESWQVHAALVAIGSSPGVPCRWAPEYTPAWGPTIEIEMMWRDAKTKEIKTIDAKQWILNSDTQKPMTTPLVFGGSYSEPQFEGEQPRYQANDGELICLANFSTSTIDLHVSKEDTDIFFEANTPLIPPINTQVYTIIKPGPVLGKPEE